MSLALFKDKLQRLIGDMESRAEVELAPLLERRNSIDGMLSETSNQITRLIRRSSDEKDDKIAKAYDAELHRLSELSKSLTGQRDETQAKIDAYGIWAQGGVSADQLQAELCETWGFTPAEVGAFGAGVYGRFDFQSIDRDKARRIVERYDLRAEVVLEKGITRLRVFSVFRPQGQIIQIEHGLESLETNDLRRLTEGT